MSEEVLRQPVSLIELAWSRYKSQLQRRPLLTKAVTSACIAGVSDVIAQAILGGPYKPGRTLKMVLYGLIWNGPSAHFWQAHLQRVFQHKTDFATAIAKVVVDQLTYGPLCNILFMAYTAIAVNGVPPALFFAQLPKTYPNVQLQGWKVWPLAGLINYRYVPLQYRVLFINLVALAWSTFLILKARAGAGR